MKRNAPSLFGQLSDFYKSLLIIIITSLGVYFGFAYVLPLVYPFIIAYILVKLLIPVVRLLKEKLRIPFVVGGTVVLFVIVMVLGVVFFFLGRALFNQLQSFLNDIPEYQVLIDNSLRNVCGHCDQLLGVEAGVVQQVVWERINSFWVICENNIMPLMTEHSINIVTKFAEIIAVLFIVIVAAINIFQDFDWLSRTYQSSTLCQVIHPVTGRLCQVGMAYLKTQLIIMSCNAVVLVIGFMIMGNPYALLAAVGIAIMDAFPVIGSGLFLFPWAFIELLNAKLYHAIILIILYCICETIRSILEPRLLGNRIGIKSIFTLMAMYVGVKLFGVIGFLLGPLSLVIIITIVRVCLGQQTDLDKESNVS